MTKAQKAGVLYVVATPIGNVADISARAVQTLKQVDMICAEDTRHSRPLLQQLGVDTPMIALHEHNETAQSQSIVERLLQGQTLALISDAGTPLVSDPGYRLVRAARAHGVQVSPIPGASALIAALSVAGLPSDRFVFEGFLPSKSSARRNHLRQLVGERRTLIFYESAHRIEECLRDAVAIFGGQRQAVLARELTKLFETVLDGDLEQLTATVCNDANQRKGEFVLMIAGAEDDEDARVREGKRVYALLCAHLSPSQAAKLAAELTGAPRKALYAGKNTET